MHGEIGQTGFLPGNALKYGVGNLRDKNTALISTANFLRAHGWRAGAGLSGQHGRHRRLELCERLSAGDRPHRHGDRRQLARLRPAQFRSKTTTPLNVAFLVVAEEGFEPPTQGL